MSREQYMAALAEGDRRRIEGARQRRELVGQPLHVVAAALINPTPEVAKCRLVTLVCRKGRKGPFPRVGSKRLAAALTELRDNSPYGRRRWHRYLRLEALTEGERRRLVDALAAQAPARWRDAISEDPTTPERSTT